MSNLRGITLAAIFGIMAGFTALTDPDHFSLTDLLDIGHFHHEHLVVFLLILAALAVLLPAFVPPSPFLYVILAGAALVVSIGMIDLLTGWT